MKPMAIGLNCALGATDMIGYIENLSKCCDCYVFAYPNAGLPNCMGGYDQTGKEMKEEVRPFVERGLVNMLGGCCGTWYDHIEEIADLVKDYEPRKLPTIEGKMRLSGLEPLNYTPDENDMRSTFLNVGERCNVAGSMLYKKAIVDGIHSSRHGNSEAGIPTEDIPRSSMTRLWVKRPKSSLMTPKKNAGSVQRKEVLEDDCNRWNLSCK